MDTKTTPLTKWQARQRNDIKAHSRYAARPHIDRRLEDMRLERELREVWQ